MPSVAPRQLWVHSSLAHFHRGRLLCPQHLAPEVIAVNPVKGAWVCAFQEREIVQERQEESS